MSQFTFVRTYTKTGWTNSLVIFVMSPVICSNVLPTTLHYVTMNLGNIEYFLFTVISKSAVICTIIYIILNFLSNVYITRWNLCMLITNTNLCILTTNFCFCITFRIAKQCTKSNKTWNCNALLPYSLLRCLFLC